jgi:4-hydroxy-4-methyl-2-oxoglutarate aldolase
MSMNGPEEAALLEFLRGTDTPTVANAIEARAVRPRTEGFPSVDLRCLFPELGVMCGYAVTAQVETVSQGSALEENRFVELFEAVERSPKPAVVVMQEIGSGAEWAAHAGEVMSTIFLKLGAAGLITNCAVRDLSAVRSLPFHYFAQGAVSSHAHFRIVRSLVPVEVLGMTVHPGTLLHGDENGIITIPEEKRSLLRPAIEQVLNNERELLTFVRKSEFRASSLRGRFLH